MRSTIRFSVDSGIATLAMNRPKNLFRKVDAT